MGNFIPHNGAKQHRRTATMNNGAKQHQRTATMSNDEKQQR